jgi:hypothetical protein
MAHYKYFFSTLRDEQVVAEIDLFGTYMDLELNVGGQLNGSFKLDQTGKRNEDILAATIPGRSFVAVERNGICIWSGYVWSRTYQSQAKNVQLFCNSFEHYPTKRLMRKNQTWLATEQINIFRELWLAMQDPAILGGNMNINVPAVFPTITPKDLTVLATDYKLYSELMSSLADGDDGFDWYIVSNRVGNQYVRELRIGYPILGAPLGPYSMHFEYPGTITNYYQTESMADAGTNVFVLGSGEAATMPYAEIQNTLLLDHGFPRWDVVAAQKDVSDQASINTLASREALVRNPPMQTISFTLKADRIPEFGSWSLGDTVTTTIKDARNPNVLEVVNRIVKWNLTPPSADGPEEVTINFAGDAGA